VSSPAEPTAIGGAVLVWIGGMLVQAALMVRAYRLLALERRRPTALQAWRQPRLALAVAVLVAVSVTVAAEARLDLHRHPVTTSQTHHHRL
jgi:hypothetical protein